MGLNQDHLDPAESADDRERPDGGAFVAGIVLGVLIGVGVGMLFAPSSGARTRHKLGRRVREMRERAQEGLDDATRGARRDLIRRRRRLRSQLDRLAGEARDKLSDAR